jgi:chitinase
VSPRVHPRRCFGTHADGCTGEILDAIEIAATPALITGCTDAIEKEGSAEFKVFGKEHTISGFEKPTETPKATRPSESEHSTASDKSSSSCPLAARVAPRDATLSSIHSTSTVAVNARICDGGILGGQYAQACLHYRSVISRNAPALDTVECLGPNGNKARPIVEVYNVQHNPGWINGWMQAPNLGCERDEYPPDIVWQGRNNKLNFVRLVPSDANKVGSALFRGICDNSVPFGTSLKNRQFLRLEVNRCKTTSWYTITEESTVPALSLDFVGLGGYVDDGMTENLCYPSTLIDDPGFALLTDDKWYNAHPIDKQYRGEYAAPPIDIVTQGKVNNPGWNKRWTDPDLDPEEILLNEGNSTRKPTDDELLEQFGILQCQSQGCEDEKSFFGIETARTMGPGRTAMASATAGTVTKVEVESVAPTDNSSPPLRQTSPQLARITGKPALAEAEELKL